MTHGVKSVLGWLEPTDARIVRAIGDSQTAQDLSGSVGEIGVHHGKLFILLDLLRHQGEAAFCIDLFDAQDENPDGSGRGDEAILRNNLVTYVGEDEDVALIRSNSMRITPRQILDLAGHARLFSVDGGHAAEIACHDIGLAYDTLAPRGVILLDDYFEREWPGVSDGTQRFFRERRPDLVPFAIGINKVYFCRSQHSALYRAAVRDACADIFFREARFMNATVDIYENGRSRLHRRFTATPFWLAIRTTLVGRTIRAAWAISRR